MALVIRSYAPLLALTVALANACAGNPGPGQRSAPAVARPPAVSDVSIEIENHNWLDVVVYAVHGGQSTRLLTVPAAGSISRILPQHVLAQHGEMRLMAHAVGNPAKFTSERIFARTGMTISWTLEIDLKRSSVAVW